MLGCQHARLTSSVGMAAQPHPACLRFADFQHLSAKPFPIARRIARARGTMRTLLPERQIVAHDLSAGFGESVRHRNQKRSVAIRTGPVREDERVHALEEAEMEKGRPKAAREIQILMELFARDEVHSRPAVPWDPASPRTPPPSLLPRFGSRSFAPKRNEQTHRRRWRAG